ncbi:hypothetical protein [Erythrobacter sp. WG]|uniref:hypothetical protein n=1 Tax=Erythrobacter sp. WG TaxID=2985510 RepID=UPI002271A8AA|nr:hypothetical protein [Erythrobacter sp. WG]MCX9145950.1 hypothetical protein [Erythrobacter sp. WG]
MPQPYRSGHSPFRQGRTVLRAGALAGPLGVLAASGALAADGLRWNLEATVPVICAILEVQTRADQPAGLAVATSCNAERYQLTVTRAAGPAGLRAARSSAGPVQISGSAVTITSTRPGYALTTIELAEPVGTERFAVTVQPL